MNQHREAAHHIVLKGEPHPRHPRHVLSRRDNLLQQQWRLDIRIRH